MWTQDPLYHQFADPFGSLVSNAAFLVAGLHGLRHADTAARRAASIGCLLIAFGSACYHANPSDATLVWDRLPMTIVFAAVFNEALAVFWNARARRWLVPMITAGAASVAWWVWTGNLVPYAVVQFGPMLALPFLIGRRAGVGRWWALLGFYALAKGLECFDAPLFEATAKTIGGHTLKHVAAAVALIAWNWRARPVRWILQEIWQAALSGGQRRQQRGDHFPSP